MSGNDKRDFPRCGWRARRLRQCTESRMNERVGLGRPIEPLCQLVEHRISTGESDHLFGRSDYVQFREGGLHLGVTDRSLTSEKRTHCAELKMKRDHVCRERPDRGNQIGDDFPLSRAQRHETAPKLMAPLQSGPAMTYASMWG